MDEAGFAWRNQFDGNVQGLNSRVHSLESRIDRLERKSHPGDILASVLVATLVIYGAMVLIRNIPALADTASA